MRPGFAVPASFLVVAVLSSSHTAFAAAEVQGTVSASTGWTDNYNATSEDGSDSAFVSLEPGFQLFVAGEKSVQRLAYKLGINVFLTDGTTSFSNNLGWDLTHTFTEFTEGLLSASVSHITTNTAVPTATGDAGGINALPVGSNQFLGFGLGAGLSHQLSVLWRTTQGVNGTYTTPVDSSGFVTGATFNGTAALGLDRELEKGNVGLNLGGTYTFIEGLGTAVPMGAGPAEDQKQVIFTGVGRYTRPFSFDWTLDLSAGVAAAAAADDVSHLDFYPTGGGTVGYQVEQNSAGLSYNHGVVLNPFLRQTIVADDFVLRAATPINKTRWLVNGAIGYQHAHTLVLEGDDPGSSLDLFSVDAAFSYEISPTMNLGIRYQFAYQKGDAAVVPDLVRNSLSVVFTAKYPDKTRTTMPFRQPLKMLRDPSLGEPDRPRGRGI